jgi:hypothetical protein
VVEVEAEALNLLGKPAAKAVRAAAVLALKGWMVALAPQIPVVVVAVQAAMVWARVPVVAVDQESSSFATPPSCLIWKLAQV